MDSKRNCVAAIIVLCRMYLAKPTEHPINYDQIEYELVMNLFEYIPVRKLGASFANP